MPKRSVPYWESAQASMAPMASSWLIPVGTLSSPMMRIRKAKSKITQNRVVCMQGVFVDLKSVFIKSSDKV